MRGIVERLIQWRPFGPVAEIAPEELAEAVARAAVQVVDVRTAGEFRRGHIPGARHLPITRFDPAAIAGLGLDPQRPVAAICLTAHRSIPAVRQLRALGYDVRQLRGGMRAWRRQGFPVEGG